jgi:Cupin domain
MSSPIAAPPLAGNVVGAVGANFVVAEWKDAGGPPGPPRWIASLHLHRNDDEAWYVLEGTLCVRVGKDVVEAVAGSAVLWTEARLTRIGIQAPGWFDTCS